VHCTSTAADLAEHPAEFLESHRDQDASEKSILDDSCNSSTIFQAVSSDARWVNEGGTAAVDTTAVATDVQQAVATALAKALAAVSGTKAVTGGAAAAGPGTAANGK
jgi:hypothetical protein